MKHRIPHGLGDVAKARNVVEHAFSSYRERLADYEPSLTWADGDTALVRFRVMGKTMEVRMELDDQAVVVEGKIPLVFRPFQGKIVGVLEREVLAWAERARTGELASK